MMTGSPRPRFHASNPTPFYSLAMNTNLAAVKTILPSMLCIVVSSNPSSCMIGSLSQSRAVD